MQLWVAAFADLKKLLQGWKNVCSTFPVFTLTCICSVGCLYLGTWVCLSGYFEEVGYLGIYNLALGKLSEDICMCRILILSGSVMNYSFSKFYLQKSIFLWLLQSLIISDSYSSIKMTLIAWLMQNNTVYP